MEGAEREAEQAALVEEVGAVGLGDAREFEARGDGLEISAKLGLSGLGVPRRVGDDELKVLSIDEERGERLSREPRGEGWENTSSS